LFLIRSPRWVFFDLWTSFDLPDDVFQPGETRPTRPKKKIIKKAEAGAQKRSIDSLDVSACKRVKQDNQRKTSHQMKADISHFG
jgi:poly(A) polymerase